MNKKRNLSYVLQKPTAIEESYSIPQLKRSIPNLSQNSVLFFIQNSKSNWKIDLGLNCESDIEKEGQKILPLQTRPTTGRR